VPGRRERPGRVIDELLGEGAHARGAGARAEAAQRDLGGRGGLHEVTG
jgi:hypothetical protein